MDVLAVVATVRARCRGDAVKAETRATTNTLIAHTWKEAPTGPVENRMSSLLVGSCVAWVASVGGLTLSTTMRYETSNLDQTATVPATTRTSRQRQI